jgi:hypothetical protein
MKLNIQAEVEKVKAQALVLSKMTFGPTYRSEDDKFWELVEDLDSRAEGLVGKHIKFGVADGYAHYIVVKAGKSMVTVEHLDYSDGYMFAGVYRGKIQRGVVDQSLRFQDWKKSLMKKV